MGVVLQTVFGVDRAVALAILIALTVVYAAVSGLWGVVATDVIQFAMAMVGAILMAALAVAQVGGLGALTERVQALGAERGRDLLAMLPTQWDAFAASVAILAFVNWWAVYYPGAEPGGGGYVAQRMLAARDEKEARSGTLWFLFAHYALRSWPWILTALAAAILEPRFLDGAPGYEAEHAYPWMFRLLPVGMLGLVVASFFAAYMSTITTMLNLAASFLVQDFLLPIAPRRSRRTEIALARGTVVFVCAAGCVVAWSLESAGEGWEVIMELTAGSGLVLILRWLWWRVNAWSEIAAMVASAVGYFLANRTAVGREIVARLGGGDAELTRNMRLLLIVGYTTVVWVAVTLATAPTSRATLVEFYRRVRPGGVWGTVPEEAGLPRVRLRRELAMWGASTLLILGALLGVGAGLLGKPVAGVAWLTTAVAGWIALRALVRGERETFAGGGAAAPQAGNMLHTPSSM